MKKLMACLFAGLFALIVSLFSLKFAGVPCIWIGLTWLLVFLPYALTCARRAVKITWLSIAAVVLALTASETALWIA